MSTDLVPAWPRPNRQGSNGQRTRQHYIAFFLEDTPEVTVNAREDGLPEGDPLASFELEAFTAPAWLRGWSAGALASFLDATPTINAAAVRRCRAALGAWSGQLDPLTLATLQGGMALCRAFARVGAIAVLDVVALRWWAPEDLLELAPARPFELSEHVTITFETTPIHPEVGHFCHTRGMGKFARPDLGIHVPGVQAAAGAGQLLTAVATALALGLDPQPHETTRVGDGPVRHFVAHPDDTGSPSPLFFNRWLELVEGPPPQLLLGSG